jgi:GMP synthase (glutamine-hydrolysing)
MKIDVVDNGGQWTHREWRVLKYLGVDSEIIPNTTKFKDLKVDGLVLSGGAARIGWEAKKLGEIGSYLDKAKFPIFGICVGHQFMALHFGGKASAGKVPGYGKGSIEILKENDLFKGIPKKITVWESHNDEINDLPSCFEVLARSKDCAVEAMKHKTKPFYGVQFHPEVEDTEYGSKIFENFLKVCKN